MKRKRFKCEYCDSRFVREGSFLNHKCKNMAREEELKSPIGSIAWTAYKNWFKFSKRRTPSASVFIVSSSYPAFSRFARFVVRVQVVDPTAYVKIMVTRTNLTPNMWTSTDAHAEYLAHLDHITPPMQLVSFSVDTLLNIASEHNIDVGDVFDVITPNELLLLLQRRRLSPWLLLKSKKFNTFFLKSTSSEEQMLLETFIKFDFWSKKFKKHSDIGKDIKSIVAELNL